MRLIDGAADGVWSLGRAVAAPLQAMGLAARPQVTRDALSPRPHAPVAEAAARLAGQAVAGRPGAGLPFSIDPAWSALAPWSAAVDDLRWLAEGRAMPTRGIAHCLCDRVW
jgi:hypothetical protein